MSAIDRILMPNETRVTTREFVDLDYNHMLASGKATAQLEPISLPIQSITVVGNLYYIDYGSRQGVTHACNVIMKWLTPPSL